MKSRNFPASRRMVLALAVSAFGIISGCRSRPPATAFGGAVADPTSPVMAAALANFGTGILRSGLGETDAALDNLRQAEALVPDNIRVSFHLAMQYLGHGQGDQAMATMATAVDRQPDSLDAYLLQARVARAAQRPEIVRQALERAIALDPRRAETYVYLAIYYSEISDTERAIAVLEDALPVVDEQLQLLRVLGDLYAVCMLTAEGASNERRAECRRRAIDCYRRANDYPPDEFRDDYRVKLGDLYLADEQYELAAKIFAELSERRPDDPDLQKRLVLSLNAARHRKEAGTELKRIDVSGQPSDDSVEREMLIASCRAAIHQAPENPRHYETLALLLVENNLPEAIVVIEDGLRRLPDDLKLKDLLARLYLQAKRFMDAWTIYQEIQAELEAGTISDLPGADFWMGYAVAAQQTGHMDEAVALYEKALASGQRRADIFLRLAFLHATRGHKSEADAVMRRATDALPQSAEIRYFAGIMAARNGDYARACNDFEHTGELARASANAAKILDANYYFYYGAACEREKKFMRAEELFRETLKIDPDHADAANYLAYMWAEQGTNLEQALLLVQHAVELQPENSAYLDTLGWVYFKMGRIDEAADEVYNSLQIDPGSPTVMEHYGDILERQGDITAARSWRENSRREQEGITDPPDSSAPPDL
jgi:tetratricopeptide (TPR) repeat protein